MVSFIIYTLITHTARIACLDGHTHTTTTVTLAMRAHQGLVVLFIRSKYGFKTRSKKNDESCFVVHLLEAAMNWEGRNHKVSCAI